VIDGAVALLRQDGADAFSVRRLASVLGVDTMAVYKHVRNRDDLLGGALAHVFQDVRPSGTGEWWEQVRVMFGEHRRVIREQPWVLYFMFNHKVRSGEPWAGVDQTLALLMEHLGTEGGARWMRLLTAYTNGFLLTEPDLVGASDTREVAAMHPRVVAAAERGAGTGDADFELGLDLLVAAMRTEAAE
jgi:AcrR family transcriptional regulator